MSIFKKLKKSRLESSHSLDLSLQSLIETFRFLNEMPLFIQEYIMSRFSLGYSKATLQRYIYDYKSFFDYVQEVTEEDFHMNNITIEDFSLIDKEMLEDYVQFLFIYAKNNGKTINRKLSALKSLFDYLKQQQHLQVNPVNEVERPKIARQEPVFLHRKEYEQLLSFLMTEQGLSERQKKYHHLLKYRDVAIFQMLMMTGLRISELCSLQMKDINFGARELTVTGKGNKQRTIPLNSLALNTLDTYFQSIPKNMRPTTIHARVFIGYNFQSQSFQPEISVSAMQKMVKRHLTRATSFLPFLAHKPISAHKLRHSFATELIQNGVDVLTVQSLLGHESVATTQIYAHVQKEAKEKAIETLK